MLSRLLLLCTLVCAVWGARLVPREIPLRAVTTTSKVAAAVNDRPIIGILTQPGDLAEGEESYFSAGYVKWLEAAGARVAPILYDMSRSEVKEIFKVLSGVVFPGGNYPLTSNTKWFQTGKLLFDLAKEANDKGDTFVIQGTCLGLQLMTTIVTGDQNILQPVDSEDLPTHLDFTPEAAGSPFLGRLPPRVLRNMAEHNISMHNHHYGLTLDTYSEYPEMARFFNVLSHTTDRDGVTYASIIEAKGYPFTGFAFHPEKVPYEWTPALHIPHTAEAVEAAFQLSASFVESARGSSHRGRDVVEEDAYLIYNWSPEFFGKHEYVDEDHSFEQAYLFRIEDYRTSVSRRKAAIALRGAQHLS